MTNSNANPASGHTGKGSDANNHTTPTPGGGTDIALRFRYAQISVKKYISTLVLAVALAGLSQAASVATPGPGATKSPARAAAPQRGLSDAQIERNIKARLARSKMSATEHFTVTVHDGVATLEGKSNVIQHKGVATRLAKMGGAIAVQNHIQISEEARAKAAAKLAKYRTGGAVSGAPARATVVEAAK